MPVRIAIPEPTATDIEYNQRSLPQYIAALQSVGAHAVIVPLHESAARVARLLADTQGILLPGSGFDVDPKLYGEKPIPACGPADPARTATDALLLEDAFRLQKPILAICAGLQSLNVWRKGSLIQDLEAIIQTRVNHRPGREVVEAHSISISANSRLEALVRTTLDTPGIERDLTDQESRSTGIAAGAKRSSPAAQASVNSSHHQAIHKVGDNLRVAAVSPIDNVIEAVELDSPDHFVVAVQWHPERTYTVNALSRALFGAFVHAAETWQSRRVDEPVAASWVF